MWPEVWTKIEKTAQKVAKQERTNEKSKLNSARRLRGIYIIDPEDEEYKETLQILEEMLMDAAMSCKHKTESHNS